MVAKPVAPSFKHGLRASSRCVCFLTVNQWISPIITSNCDFNFLYSSMEFDAGVKLRTVGESCTLIKSTGAAKSIWAIESLLNIKCRIACENSIILTRFKQSPLRTTALHEPVELSIRGIRQIHPADSLTNHRYVAKDNFAARISID
jgi:hypothetical protein